MSDDFMKIVEVVQATGKAPVNPAQTTSTTTLTAKIVTEGLQPTAKTYRFTANESSKTDSNND